MSEIRVNAGYRWSLATRDAVVELSHRARLSQNRIIDQAVQEYIARRRQNLPGESSDRPTLGLGDLEGIVRDADSNLSPDLTATVERVLTSDVAPAKTLLAAAVLAASRMVEDAERFASIEVNSEVESDLTAAIERARQAQVELEKLKARVESRVGKPAARVG